MKFLSFAVLAATLIESSLGHYIFTNINGNSAVVRQPANNSPVTDVTSTAVRCNVPPSPASSVLSVAAGSTVGIFGPYYTATNFFLAEIWAG